MHNQFRNKSETEDGNDRKEVNDGKFFGRFLDKIKTNNSIVSLKTAIGKDLDLQSLKKAVRSSKDKSLKVKN